MKNYLSIYCLAFLLIFGSIGIALCNSTHNLSIQVDSTDTLKINKAQTDSVESSLTGEPSDTTTLIDDFLESTVAKVIAFIVPIIALFVALLFSKQLWLWWKRKWDLSYQRYLKNIQTKFRNEENYEKFPDIKLIPESSEDSNNGSTIPDILSSTDKVYIKGKPGAGKTSLIKKFFVELSKKRERGESELIPIYLEYRGKDLFNQIRSNFSSNELFTNTELLTLDWIKTQLINKKQQYIICIDDVDSLLAEPNAEYNSQIKDLLDYRNKYVLISRDYISTYPFSDFDYYEIQDLSNDWELIEQVLQIYADEAKAKRIQGHLKHGMDEKLMRLYNTPQHLKFLAKVFDPELTLEDNKSSLFNRFLNVREEERKRETSSKWLDLSFKKRILGFIAFNLFIQEDDRFSASKLKVRELLKKIFDELDSKYGWLEYSIPFLEDILFREGYLIEINGDIRFEHDQWQEFFAALEIHSEEKSITPFLSKNFGSEIVLFVSGLYELEEELTKRDFWQNFWEELVLSDFFLTKWCRENRQSYTLGEVGKVYEDFTHNEEEFFKAYRSVLAWYEKIIAHHFPNLMLKFAPSGSKNVGLLVEQNENKVGQLYGYRPITTKNKDKVLVTNQKEIMRQINADDPGETVSYYRKEYDISYLHSYLGTSAVQSYPVEFAFMDVESQLSDFVREGSLIETEIMNEEALFIEAVSLSAKIKGHLGGLSNISKHKVLLVGELLSGIERFKNDDFKSTFRVPDARHSNLGRNVAFKEFEGRFKKYIQTQNLENEDKLEPPNANLINVIKNYRLNDEKLIKEHREFLINRSARFYKDVYENYKKVIETNFPTVKHSFRSYSFPIQIFLIRKESNNKKSFGIRLVYFGVDKLKDPVSVKVVDEKEILAIKNEFKEYSGYNYAWRLNSFSIIEPLRNTVYQLINNEYKELNRSSRWA